jgi:hypothetical protein
MRRRILSRISDFLTYRIDNYRLWRMHYIIKRNVKNRRVIMDIGCWNKPQTIILAKEQHYLIDPQEQAEQRSFPYIQIVGTWKNSIPLMQMISVDVVFLIDVIEHLEKEEALHLLHETEKYTKQIVVFTPLGFMPQEDGQWNTHKSGWMPEDFGTGWKVWTFPKFHHIDFNGRTLPIPYGAILALYRRQ